MKLYHLTNKENVSNILKEGILPKCGKNTQLVEKDIGDYTFLTDKEDLDIWATFLNKDYVIEVELENTPRIRKYGYLYNEYYVDEVIMPSSITNHYEYKLGEISDHTKDVIDNYLTMFINDVCDRYCDCDYTCQGSAYDDRMFISEEMLIIAANPLPFKKFLPVEKCEYEREFNVGRLELYLEDETDTLILKNVRTFINWLKENLS
jgi:hypothetical protein